MILKETVGSFLVSTHFFPGTLVSKWQVLGPRLRGCNISHPMP